jgi:hypothetical protein
VILLLHGYDSNKGDPVMREARRGLRGRIGVLAVSVAVSLVAAASIAAAETVTKTFPAEIVAMDKFNPTNALQCGALGFVKWQDPPLTVEEIPIAWRIIYTHRSRGELSESVNPPFHDSITHVGAEYLVGGGAHWWVISWGSKVGAGAVTGCSFMTENILARYSSPRVEITFDLKVPSVNIKKCQSARAELRKRNRAVSQLLGKLRKASTSSAKNKIRKQLSSAKNKRVNAIQKLNDACN